jgi:hypothetical protein
MVKDLIQFDDIEKRLLSLYSKLVCKYVTEGGSEMTTHLLSLCHQEYTSITKRLCIPMTAHDKVLSAARMEEGDSRQKKT